MTRETKVGLVVAVSFLCLVGVVVSSRLRRHADDAKANTVVQDINPGQKQVPPEKKEPAKTVPEDKTHAAVVQPATFKDGLPGLPAPAPIKLSPMPGDELNPVINPPPVAPPPVAPPVDLTAEELHHKQMLKDLENAKKPAKEADPTIEENHHKQLLKDLENAKKPAKEVDPTIIPGRPQDDPPAPVVFNPVVPPVAPPPMVPDKKDLVPAPPVDVGIKAPVVPLPGEPFKAPKKEGRVDTLPMESPAPIKPMLPTAPPVQPPPAPKDGLPEKLNSNIPAPPPQAKQDITMPPPPPPISDLKPKTADPAPPITNPTPPVQNAFNKEPTNPTLPPLGAEIKNPMPTVSVPSFAVKPASNSAPKVTSFDPITYLCKPEDTTFEAVSNRLYGSTNYAGALLQYNRVHPLQVGKDNLLKDNPRLLPNQAVFVPPKEFLESHYPTLIGSRPAVAPTPSPITLGPPPSTGTAPPPPTVPIIGRTPNPVVASNDPTKAYRVPSQGQMLIEIAQQTLGDRARWSEIYRLNPTIRPEFPVPGGTEIRLPANASVP